jgi:hypothetical protein
MLALPVFQAEPGPLTVAVPTPDMAFPMIPPELLVTVAPFSIVSVPVPALPTIRALTEAFQAELRPLTVTVPEPDAWSPIVFPIPLNWKPLVTVAPFSMVRPPVLV